MTEGSLSSSPAGDRIDPAPGMRNAWQWLAMITMTLDHIGYLFSISELRYPGRLGMPLYAILFVITLRKNQIHLGRVVLLAILSQIQYMYIFQQSFYLYDFRLPQLNIIFGFAIFAWFAAGVRQQNRFKMISGLMMMLIPVSYGWYLYLTLAIFYWVQDKYTQRGAFAFLMMVYTYTQHLHPRQLLAILVPFLTWLKAPRPNKYLYRYFYPGHLLILAAINFWALGTPLSLPIGRIQYELTNYHQYNQTEPYDDDNANEPDMYDVIESEQ